MYFLSTITTINILFLCTNKYYYYCRVILYVLLAGFLPFDEKTIMELFAKIQNADYTCPSFFSPEIKRVIELILVADPKLRISSSDLKRHAYLSHLFTDADGDAKPAVSAPISPQLKAGLSMPGTAGISPSPAKPISPGFDGPSARADTERLAQNLQKLALEAQDPNLHPHDANDVEEETIDPNKRWSDIQSSLEDEIGVLKKLNAFDLVNQCGGFGMDQIFSPNIFYKSVSPGAPSDVPSPRQVAPSRVDGKAVSISSSFTLGVQGCYNFTSSAPTAQVLITAVHDIMQKDGWSHSLALDVSLQSGMIRATKMSPKGMIGVGVTVYILCTSLQLLQIVRGKGDRLEWNKMYQELVESKLAHLLNVAKATEQAGR